MKVKLIPIVAGALETVSKSVERGGGLEELEISGRIETTRLLYCWDLPEYWEESWRPEVICCHSDSSERPPVNADVKNHTE